MKKHILEFLKRGLMAAAGGPVVLAIVYGILGAVGVAESFTPAEVCTGILTVTLMAFLAAGITVVYRIEQLPLFWAILLHGGVLYADYILIYLLNGFLKRQLLPVLVFTGVFIVGYAVIWLIVYASIKAKTDSLNAQLQKKAL